MSVTLSASASVSPSAVMQSPGSRSLTSVRLFT